MRRPIIVGAMLLAAVFPAGAALAQSGALTGSVTVEDTSQPVAGARVAVEGTALAVTTTSSGQYLITGIPAGTHRVAVSVVGYEIQVAQNVQVSSGRTQTVNFALKRQAAVELEGIVAVGYGTQRRRDVTGAIGSVGAEELDRVQVPTVAQALQGRVAGVNVTQNSAAPGGGVSVRIRGGGSLSSTNEPLYVVDGVPISGASHNDPITGGARTSHTNPLAFLNPEDIESIEVLKDASSTAIYGARGTNGVVLISTKKGRSGTSRIEFESSFATQQVANRLAVLNPQQFAEFANEFVRLGGHDAVPFPNPSAVTGIDYQDLVFRANAPMMEHNVSVLGGTDRTSFALSANYLNHEGVVRGSEFQRYSLRTNVQHEAQSWLTLGANVNVGRVTPRVGFTEGAKARAEAGVVGAAQEFVPLIPIHREDGQYTWMDRDFVPELSALGYNGSNIENPMGILNETQDDAEFDRLLGNAFMQADLLPGLSLRLNGGANVVNNARNEYYTSRSRKGINNGAALIGVVDQSHYVAEALLNYVGRFGGVHALDVIAGTTYETERTFNRFIRNTNFPNDLTKFYNIGAGTPTSGPQVSSGYNDWRLLSYLGRVNYGLADKYLFTFTGRADGSSKFGADNKWGFFPSAALAWRISEEPFLQGAGWLSDLKLRVSYGHTGNQEIGTYRSLARMNNTNYNFGGTAVSAFEVGSLANPNLRWERSEQFDAGFDAALLDNRLSLTFDVYDKTTDDLLLQVPLPWETGFSSALQNLGSVRNRGAELVLGLDVLEGIDGALGWRSSFNVSANRSKVLDIGDRPDIIGNAVGGGFPGLLVRKDEALGVFYGYETDGLFRTQAEADAYVGPDGKPILPGAVAGQRKFVDQNGDGVINAQDRVILGNPEPDFVFGWSNDFTVGRFGLYAFVQGTRGNDIFNVQVPELSFGTVGRNMYEPAWAGRWTPENPNAKWPIINLPPGVGYASGARGELQDWMVEDGSYLRLRNLTLSYDVPETVTGGLASVRTARIFLGAENLFTLHDYSGGNPDVNVQGQNSINRGIDVGSYPLARIYRVGIRLGL